MIKVSDGYARNYLIPRKLALPVTEANRKKIEQQMKQIVIKQVKEKSDAESLSQQFSTISLTISKKAGEDDLLFGTVTNAEIAEEMNKLGIEIDKRKIILEEPIRRLGIYQVPVKLHKDVLASVKVWVVKE
ncbi:MAG: 50S ribosomal protein L9 [Candidatus Fischerbacteria bacterium RBG_13_37_8]|uniref:Large ribosomal subunit protein bL9 n=1 Tax=Candidatus Fischerbacteria bacterium RBG_13_37_8 TaxID=1817863 RepID=A0A1F5V8J4_9BACT|nr:MAG: 50S ribosomal protein L9 [Candidatus Fischerbacteria bacterium RBG_13_37_8]